MNLGLNAIFHQIKEEGFWEGPLWEDAQKSRENKNQASDADLSPVFSIEKLPGKQLSSLYTKGVHLQMVITFVDINFSYERISFRAFTVNALFPNKYTQNNPYSKKTYFDVAYSGLLQLWFQMAFSGLLQPVENAYKQGLISPSLLMMKFYYQEKSIRKKYENLICNTNSSNCNK